MEPQLESLAGLLLKKSGDTNVFISAQGKSTLKAMIHYTSEVKCLNSIQPYIESKNGQIKSQVAVCFGEISEKLGTKIRTFKDSDKLLLQMETFLSDANQNVRENT